MYEHFIQRASYGYKDDYQFILNLISFINMPIELDKQDFIKQRFLNYGYTDYLHLGR